MNRLLAAVFAVTMAVSVHAQPAPAAPTADQRAYSEAEAAKFRQSASTRSSEQATRESAAAAAFAAKNAAASADDVKRMKELANESATRSRSAGVELDANGNIRETSAAVTGDGTTAPRTSGTTASTAPASSRSVTQQGEYLKGVTGVAGVETLSNPAARGGGAGATTNLNGYVDFKCTPGASGQLKSFQGVQVRMDSCTGQGGAVAMEASVCTASMRAAVTCGPQDFQRVKLSDGQYTAVDSVTLGLGCNDNKVCRVSLSGSVSIQGTGAQLTEQSRTQQQKELSNGNSYSSGLTQVYGSDEFSRQVADSKQNNVVTVIQGAQNGSMNCSSTGQCLHPVDTTRTFNKTCDRSFVLTERTETFDTPASATRVCTEHHTGSDVDSAVTWNDCWWTETGGDSGGFYDSHAMDAYTKVGSRLVDQCSNGGDNGCDYTTFEVYYVKTDQLKRTAVGYSPYQLSTANPTCDERPEGKVHVCEDNQWFGRTLPADQCIGSDSETDFAEQVDYTTKSGCGVCMHQQVMSTCYGEPASDESPDSCGDQDLTGCTSTGSAALTFTGDRVGLVTSQRETYSCTKTTTTCSEYEGKTPEGNSCTLASSNVEASTFGIGDDIQKTQDIGSFAQATADLAMANEMTSSVQDAGAENPGVLPLIFSGKDMRCSYPTSSLLGAGGLLNKNCCRMDLTRPKKGVLIQHGCSDAEVELSTSRRANYAHFVGEYCSKKAFFGKCLVKKQTHCTFNGMLPRLIAEQGRDQLTTLAAGGAGGTTQRAPVRFAFYSSQDTGSWSAPVRVNGVSLAAWQWPKFCSDPAQQAKKQSEDHDAPSCPGALNVWFAACDVVSGCGELPGNPDLGSMGWTLANADPLSKMSTATSRYSVVTGACDTASSQCTYEVSAWPAGQGGKVIITRDISFPLFDRASQGTTAQGFGVETKTVMGQQQNISDIFYRPYSYAAWSTTLPPTVRIDFSTDGGTANWTTVQVPTNAKEFSVPGTDLKLSGSCDATIGACTYRMVGTAVVETKGWGSARDPDCEGFTAGQIAAMDFSKMDLSQWLDEVMAKNKTDPNLAEKLASAAKNQVASANTSGGGQIAPQQASPVPFALATPPEFYGPATVNLAVSGWWPYAPTSGAQNAEKVTSVQVKWGDCGAYETLPLVTTINGQPAHGFRGSHRYQAPNDSAYSSCGVAREGVPATHVIEVKALTDKGVTHTTTLSVSNVWSTFTGSHSNTGTTTPPTGP